MAIWASQWQKLISKSEKIVCYPSSFINIRYLISDELANVVTHVRRLVGTQHPLLKIVRSIIGDGKGFSQIRGLLVLLMSKTMNSPSQNINANQRRLSEIVETASAALCIHRNIIDTTANPNLTNSSNSTKWFQDMQFGNKMSTISGDYLLASVSRALADLKNTDIVYSVSEGIGNSIESLYSTRNFTEETKYRHHIYLSNGSLLSRCCKATVTVKADDVIDETNRRIEEKLAENWAITWSELYSVCLDIDAIVTNLSNGIITSSILQQGAGGIIGVDITKDCLPKSLEFLHRIRVNLSENEKLLPDNDVESKRILSEMSSLLFREASSNASRCLKQF